MNYQLLQGDNRAVLRTLPDQSVHCIVTSPPYLFDVIAGGVLLAVYPMMAFSAQGDDVGEVKSERWVSRPRLDVVSVQTFTGCFRRSTSRAAVIVSLVNYAKQFLPFGRRVFSLSLWRTAVHVMRIQFARSARHAVAFAAQPGLFFCRFFAEYLARFFAVRFALKRIFYTIPAHVAVIGVGEVVASGASFYSKVNKFIVDVFWIAIYEFTNVICGQFFYNIFLVKPVSI